MEFLSSSTHQPAGNKNTNTGGRQSTDNKSWSVVTVQLLKLSPVVNWHEKLVVGKIMAGIISQSYKRFRGNNNYKNKRFEWMLLSTIKALKKDNAKLRAINHKLRQIVKVRRIPSNIERHSHLLQPEGRNC